MPASRKIRPPRGGASSHAYPKSSVDITFSDRSVLIPPARIQTYEDYTNWIILAGGDPSPVKKRHTAKREKGHIPRPPNSFILFRSWATLVAKSCISDQACFSKEASIWWSELTEREQAAWIRISTILKNHHQDMYPGYRYTPNRDRLATSSRPQAPVSPHHFNFELPVASTSKRKGNGRRRRSPSTEPGSSYVSEYGTESPPRSPPTPAFSNESQPPCHSGAGSARSGAQVTPGIMEALRPGSPNSDRNRSPDSKQKQRTSSGNSSELSSDFSSEEDNNKQESQSQFASGHQPTFVPTYTSLPQAQVHPHRVTGMNNPFHAYDPTFERFAGMVTDNSAPRAASSSNLDTAPSLNNMPNFGSLNLFGADSPSGMFDIPNVSPNNWTMNDVTQPDHHLLGSGSLSSIPEAQDEQLFSEWLRDF